MPVLVNPYIVAPVGGGGPGSLPVNGAVLWLAPDFGLYTDAGTTPVSANGDHIYQWSDQSGNDYHFVQTVDGPTNPPFRPLYRTGVTDQRGNRCVEFVGGTGLNESMFDVPDALGSALSGAATGEMFVVKKSKNANNAGFAAMWHDFSPAVGLGTCGGFMMWSNDQIFEGFGTSVQKNWTPAADMTAFHVYDVWSASGDYGVFIDNTSEFTTAVNTVSFRTTAIQFGHNAGGAGHYLDSYVSEIVIFPFKLSTPERDDMFTYLST